MDKVRAEILTHTAAGTAAARILISAPARTIFYFLADPHTHAYFDGSTTVQKAFGPMECLALGSRFGMRMKIYIPYRITNTVTGFDDASFISWKHLGGWTWSYSLREIGLNETEVTETFDLNTAPRLGQWWANRTDSLTRNPKWMAKSLVLLKALSEQ